MRCIGILGGTFDPIHYGHLRTALERRLRLGLAHVRFVPCYIPPTQKTPLLSAAERLGMVEAAIESEWPDFVVDRREIDRGGVSYTVDTLESLRAEFADTAMALLVGMDAFLSLTTWRDWRRILTLAHIVVAHRPGWDAPTTGELAELLEERATRKAGDLHSVPAGSIHIEPVTQLEISSSALRGSISAGIDPKYLVPPSVRSLILETECYAKERETVA